MPLTCRNAADQLTCRAARSVRDVGAAGSNPATPTQVTGHLRGGRRRRGRDGAAAGEMIYKGSQVGSRALMA